MALEMAPGSTPGTTPEAAPQGASEAAPGATPESSLGAAPGTAGAGTRSESDTRGNSDIEELEPSSAPRREAMDAAGLCEFYRRGAQATTNESEGIALLRAGIRILQAWDDAAEHVATLERELVVRDPADGVTATRLIGYYEKEGQVDRLVDLLEVLCGAGAVDEQRRVGLRRELFSLHVKLNAPERAAAHLAALLRAAPDVELVEAAEGLCRERALLGVLAPPLTAIYEREQRAVEELGLLTRELDVASGDRLAEVEWRLVTLRDQVLDDPEGALELASRLVTRDPGHEEYGARFVALSGRLGRQEEAERHLAALRRAPTDEGFQAAPAVHEEPNEHEASAEHEEPGSQQVSAVADDAPAQQAPAAAARQTLTRAVELDPEDPELHGALLAALDAARDVDAAVEELRRASEVFVGDRRVEVLLEWSRRASGDSEVVHGLLTDAVTETSNAALLEAIHRRADDEGLEDLALLALRRALDGAVDSATRSERLERLAEYLQLRGDAQEAADCWLAAATALTDGDGEAMRQDELYRRSIEADPSRKDVARSWIHASIARGGLQAATMPFETLVQYRAQHAAELALEMKEAALASGAAETYASWIDELVFTEDVAPETNAELLRAKAEAYDVVGRRTAAGDAYRTLIETTNADEDVALFETVLGVWPLDEETKEHLRWLYERRVERAERPTEELLSWAKTEEERFEDVDAALALAERALEFEPDHLATLSYVAELRLGRGATDGAVEALERWLLVDGERDARLAVRVARLYLDELGRPDDAVRLVCLALDVEPTVAGATEFALQLLESERSPALVDALGRAVAALPEPRAVLRALLEPSAPDGPQAPEREGWFDRLIELSPDPADKLAYSCRAVAELEYSPERLARARSWVEATERPEPLLAAYAGAISTAPDTAAVTLLGRELLEFFDEWFGDPRPLVEPLLVVLERVPNARWALQRVGLALNLQERHELFLDLLEHAIGCEEDLDARAALLEEAAVTAKDLARDPGRAVAFLEELLQLRPGDLKTQSQLERLYEQEGETSKLIDLLQDRLRGLDGDSWFDMQARIATLWLELGDTAAAARCADDLLHVRPDAPVALELLERALETCTSGAGVDASDPAEILWTVASRLASEYERLQQHEDAVRVVDAALAAELEDEQRVVALESLAHLHRDCRNDRRAAFDALARLLLLDPRRGDVVAELAELAGPLGAVEDYSRVLDEAAFVARTEERRAELYFEAARVLAEAGADLDRQRELHQRVLDGPVSPELRWRAAQELDRIYQTHPDPSAHAPLLVLMADLAEATAPDGGRAVTFEALGRAAVMYQAALRDAAAAETCWRRRLDLEPGDAESLDGLVEVLACLGDRNGSIEALLLRANLTDSPRARADLGEVARLYVELGDMDRAIETWHEVRRRFGPDAESSSTLLELLAAEERWLELCDSLREEVSRAQGAERSDLCVRLGRVERDRMGDAPGALRSLANGEAWDECRELVRAVGSREAECELATALAGLAVDAWQRGAGEPAEETSFWATERWVCLELSTSPSGADHRTGRSVLEALERLSSLPFAAERRRGLQHLRARVLAEKLERPEEALEAYRDLFLREGGDAVAVRAFDGWIALLQEQPLELARAHYDHGVALTRRDPVRAARHLIVAADRLRELGDLAFSETSLRRAAQLNDREALERCVQDHLAAERPFEAIRTLEQLAALEGGDGFAETKRRQAALYLDLGAPRRAAEALERACAAAPAEEPLRLLVELYDNLRVDERRGEALAKLAEVCSDPAEARRCRLQAARIHRRGGRAEAAIELLSPEATDASEVIEYALVSSALGHHDAAEAHLVARIEAYGGRRTKPCAKLHRALAHLYRATERHDEALQALATATSIDPANAHLVFEFAELATSRGDLPAAERALQSLLLLPPPERGKAGVERPDVYLLLSRIAEQKGDHARASDLVESACECAFEGPKAAEGLVRALRRAGRYELVGQALERVRSRASGTEESLWVMQCVARHFQCSELDAGLVAELEDRMARLGETLDEGATQSVWRQVVSVEQWLGRPERVERARLALAAAPLGELGVGEVLDEARHLAGAGRVELALSLLHQARGVGRDLAREREVLEVAVLAEPENRDVRLELAALQRLPGDEAARLETLTALTASPEARAEDVQAALHAAAELERWTPAAELLPRLPPEIVGEGEERLELFVLAAEAAERAQLPADAARLLQRAAAQRTGGERSMLLRRSCELARAAGARELELGGELESFDLEPRESEHALRVAELFSELGRHDELATLLRKVEAQLVQPRERARLEVAIARARLANGTDEEEALACLRRVVVDDPGLSEAAELLAAELGRRGRQEELLQLLLELEGAGQRDRGAARAVKRRVAALLVESGRIEEARERYRELVQVGAEREVLIEAVALQERVEGDPREKAELLSHLLRRESGEDAVRCAFRLAAVWDASGQPERARAALVSGLERAPESFELWEGALAKCLELNQVESAVALLDAPAAERLDPELRVSKRVELLEVCGRWSEASLLLGEMKLEEPARVAWALEVLQRARSHLSMEQLRNASRGVALALVNGGRAAQAYEVLSEPSVRGDADPELLRELVELALRTGEEEKVLRALGDLIDREETPRCEDALRFWQAARSLHAEASARPVLERALQTQPHVEALRNAMAEVLEALGDHRALAEHLVRGLPPASRPRDRARALRRIAALERGSSPELATARLSEAHELDPTFEGALELAASHAANGRADQAVALLSDIAGAKPGRDASQRARVHHEIAKLHLAAYDLVEAHEAQTLAFKLDMKNAEIVLPYALLALDLDDEVGARKALRTLASLKPGEVDGHDSISRASRSLAFFHLGVMALRRGDKPGAKRMAARAVEEHAENESARALLQAIA